MSLAVNFIQLPYMRKYAPYKVTIKTEQTSLGMVYEVLATQIHGLLLGRSRVVVDTCVPTLDRGRWEIPGIHSAADLTQSAYPRTLRDPVSKHKVDSPEE